ncbi:potassium-transporting ATPase subunit KdpC [Methanocella sp.]|uniref:potassium-transporting ATPase subunit KdpC n=1 Tax=Methanocella sp. TaxID=2052833 RepID=UPI002D7EAB0E|nr:potassium-transporting ATPase subunit KdpC [Methanocella sp.]
MIKDILAQIKPLVVIFAALFILTGFVYPAVVYIIGQVAFPAQANGSLIYNNSTVVGSTLIGQPFSDPRYFQSRPSYTVSFPYNSLASGGSNYGPTNKHLISDVSNRTAFWKNRTGASTVPSDLVEGSASGLDPHISLEAALFQVPVVAKARGLDNSTVEKLVMDNVEGPLVGTPGESIVNVVQLNMALDALK